MVLLTSLFLMISGTIWYATWHYSIILVFLKNALYVVSDRVLEQKPCLFMSLMSGTITSRWFHKREMATNSTPEPGLILCIGVLCSKYWFLPAFSYLRVFLHFEFNLFKIKFHECRDNESYNDDSYLIPQLRSLEPKWHYMYMYLYSKRWTTSLYNVVTVKHGHPLHP